MNCRRKLALKFNTPVVKRVEEKETARKLFSAPSVIHFVKSITEYTVSESANQKTHRN
jgi:type III secretory pathway component EscU